jgi:hypothetical protein
MMQSFKELFLIPHKIVYNGLWMSSGMRNHSQNKEMSVAVATIHQWELIIEIYWNKIFDSHLKNELPSVLLNWNMTNGKDKNVRKSGDQLDIAGYKIDSMWNFHLSISGALEQSPSIVYWMKSSPWWVHSWHKYVHSWLKNWKVCVLWRRWYKIPKTMNIVDYKYLLFQLWFNKNSKSIIPFDSCFDGRSASLLPKKSVTWAL